MKPTIHPSLQRSIRWIPPYPVRAWSLSGIRRLMQYFVRKPHGQDVSVQDLCTASGRIRVFRPEQPSGDRALLWIHGGGLVLGTPAYSDARCQDLARELDVVVIAPYYRLAPEHPYPAALDDCFNTWTWVLAHGEDLGLPGLQTFIVGGESAGGGLAAALSQRLLDAGVQLPAAQLLVYPMLDCRTAQNRSLDSVRYPIWNNHSNRTGWQSYLGQDYTSDSVPDHAVPALREDLAGLPPAWIGVGTADLFLDEDVTYAERLIASSVPCELKVVEGAYHGFDELAYDNSMAQAFTASMLDFARKAFAGGFVQGEKGR